LTATKDRDAPFFDWAIATARLVAPLKVAIIEALDWIGEPLSASDLSKILDGRFTLQAVAYNIRALAKAEVIVEVRERHVRGAVQKYYFFY